MWFSLASLSELLSAGVEEMENFDIVETARDKCLGTYGDEWVRAARGIIFQGGHGGRHFIFGTRDYSAER